MENEIMIGTETPANCDRQVIFYFHCEA